MECPLLSVFHGNSEAAEPFLIAEDSEHSGGIAQKNSENNNILKDMEAKARYTVYTAVNNRNGSSFRSRV